MGNPYKKKSGAWKAYESALDLTQDGRFSSDDFKKYRKSWKGYGTSLPDVLARAAYENNAQIDHEVKKRTGIQQDRTSAGLLTTTFQQGESGRGTMLDRAARGFSRYTDNRAAITGIGRGRNKYTPNGTKRGRPIYTRTYTHVQPTERWEENPSAGNVPSKTGSAGESQIDNRPDRDLSNIPPKPRDDGQVWAGGTPHFDESTGRYNDGQMGIGDFMRDQFDPSKIKDPDGKPETNSGSLLKRFIGKVPQLGDISKLYKSYASSIK